MDVHLKDCHCPQHHFLEVFQEEKIVKNLPPKEAGTGEGEKLVC
jgi:hypothetical protein